MKKPILITLTLTTTFLLGFAFKSVTIKNNDNKMKRVTGIGGIFFKCNDPAKMKEWYKAHLGFDVNQFGAKFDWHLPTDTTNKGYTLWTPFSEKTKYFE